MGYLPHSGPEVQGQQGRGRHGGQGVKVAGWAVSVQCRIVGGEGGGIAAAKRGETGEDGSAGAGGDGRQRRAVESAEGGDISRERKRWRGGGGGGMAAAVSGGGGGGGGDGLWKPKVAPGWHHPAI